ncbi:large subunit ribosomal protein L9 [Marchantia polymorpha subsp. ruderalis]|uniref:Large ribosomal subunit protein bL9c n=2 Tax=Marchantia polymorpha TaxID=3197 RepID=A0A176VQT9_MARPO|nr:hypothetical protein AXG93_620s1260 [Marchantia polymorpha subsp. ruderalis]PTQ48362.1 hypothetical protein MARPO_0005s0034 [Marchantia polymorpha]BBM97441.1 hypothetical protein Mp_1g05730 [Marchantia polymorpha subsp. ruderalis]|eukprot:PTQ48362.1 hypothetical protein MARPO_0005s0034 [Marchantia polymorpha]
MASAVTMAVSAPTSSMRVLPSFDGLRAQQLPTSVKAVAAPLEKSGSLLIVADKKVQKRRQIVLTEDIPALGKVGELLSVKTGYFRNYLYPTGKAKIATAELLKSIKLEADRVAAEKRKVKEEAENIARQFQAVGFFNVRRRGGQGKQIFGSVTAQDVVDIIRAQTGRDVDKRVVTVPEIREVGQYTVEVKLHPEVIAPVKINVIAK